MYFGSVRYSTLLNINLDLMFNVLILVFSLYLIFFWYEVLSLNKEKSFGLQINNKNKGLRNNSFAQKRYYSTNSTANSNLTDEEFAHWFSGFCYA